MNSHPNFQDVESALQVRVCGEYSLWYAHLKLGLGDRSQLETGLTEEQITDIFSSAGKVVSFRLVYDRETGRPKGFGFAEYPDAGKSQEP